MSGTGKDFDVKVVSVTRLHHRGAFHELSTIDGITKFVFRVS